MVASRKKIKAQQEAVGEENVAEMVEERRLKVKKRKEGKHQAAKEAAKLETAEVAAPAEINKEGKKKRKEVQGDENAADGENGTKKKKKKKDILCVEETVIKPKDEPQQQDDEIVLNVKESAGDAKPKEPKDKRKKHNQKKKKQVDRWGAPVIQTNGAGHETEEHVNGIVQEQVSQVNQVNQDQYVPRGIFASGMPFSTSLDDIHSYFSECGVIEELECAYFPDTGKFNGMAFITFMTEAAMNNALALDGSDMGGRYLKIQKWKVRQERPEKPYREPPPKVDGCLSAYIGNLSWDVTEEALREFFGGCNIKAIRFAENKETGEFRGFGHIDFMDDESLEKAIKLNQEELLGRAIKIAYAVGAKTGGASQNQNRVGRKSRPCYKCGEEGHFAVECPKNV